MQHSDEQRRAVRDLVLGESCTTCKEKHHDLRIFYQLPIP